MHEIFSREPDPIDGMLRPPSPEHNEALRQAVYNRTRRVLQRRRRLRQLAYAAALLISFAVGAGAMRMKPSAPISDPPVPSASKAEPKIPEAPPPSSDGSALEREWLAFDSEDHSGELYRQAGDRYITEENDPQSALRCYSNALDNGTEQDLAISTDDNWLLMAIKDSRQKEKNHAKRGG